MAWLHKVGDHAQKNPFGCAVMNIWQPGKKGIRPHGQSVLPRWLLVDLTEAERQQVATLNLNSPFANVFINHDAVTPRTR